MPVRLRPVSAGLYDLGGAGDADLGDHERFGASRNDDGGGVAEGVGGGDAGEAGVAAGGGVEVEVRGGVSEDGGADEVPDAAGLGQYRGRKGGAELTDRDLKEPEGWRFSSLRKIRLRRM